MEGREGRKAGEGRLCVVAIKKEGIVPLLSQVNDFPLCDQCHFLGNFRDPDPGEGQRGEKQRRGSKRVMGCRPDFSGCF